MHYQKNTPNGIKSIRLWNKREEFELKVQKDQTELDKDLMEKMMGCDQNHSKESDIYNRSFPEKIQIVKDFKTKGNEYFKENDYEKAWYFYAKALLQFYYIIPEDERESNEVDPLKLSCHLNQAIWFHKQKRYDEGLTECYQALWIDPNNIKGLYRQALLQKAKTNFTAAIADTKKGLELEPNNKALKELLVSLKSDVKEYINTSKKVYGKMMQGKVWSWYMSWSDDIGEEEDKIEDKDDKEEEKQDKNEEDKVVELGPDYEEQKESFEKQEFEQNIDMKIEKVESEIKHMKASKDDIIDKGENKHSSMDIEGRLERLEKIVEDIKFSMDILKGFGAIPPKMPDKKEQKEILKLQKDLDDDWQRQRNNRNQPKSQKWIIDDWVSLTALLLLVIVLSVTWSVLLIRFTAKV